MDVSIGYLMKVTSFSFRFVELNRTMKKKTIPTIAMVCTVQRQMYEFDPKNKNKKCIKIISSNRLQNDSIFCIIYSQAALIYSTVNHSFVGPLSAAENKCSRRIRSIIIRENCKKLSSEPNKCVVKRENTRESN